MAVWFGQVTVGFTGIMEAATTPCFASLRKVGMGSLGSSRAYAGNPSKLITTTVLSLRTFVSARRDPDAAYIINARVHRGDKSPTSLLNEILPYFPVANCESQLSAKNKTKAHIVAAPHDVVCSPGIIEEIAVNTSRQIGLAF